MDQVIILYNGSNPFYPQPVPFVGLDENQIYYNELWGKEETTILQGQLTGCTFADIVAAQQRLVNQFAQNYQPLEIWQEVGGVSGRVYHKDLVEVDSITFPEDRWVGVLPYTITLRCYPANYFSGAAGILNPNETWSFSENEDYTTNVTHTLSCRGLNTSRGATNALQNARNWAAAKRGLGSVVTPAFIQNVYSDYLCLTTSAEEIDRFNGTYSIVDSYTSDQARTGYGVARYSTSFESGDNGISVTLQGTVQGCQQNMDSVRNVFSGLNKYLIAANSYQRIFGRSDLNPVPLNYGVTEDPYATSLEFTYAYDNDDAPEVAFDYEVGLSSGNSINASINGTIIVRGGDLKTKTERAIQYARSVDLYNLTVPFYNQFYPSYAAFPLNPRPLASGISVNRFDGSISINAEFGNQEQVSPILDRFDFSLSFTPSTLRFDSQPVINGGGNYSIVNLGYANRASLGINGNAVINAAYSSDAGIQAIKNEAQALFNQYGRMTNVALETNNVTVSRSDERIVSFSFSWSFDSPNLTNAAYSTLGSLTV